MDKARLLIATKNRGKFEEFQRLLTAVEVEVISLTDLGIDAEKLNPAIS